MCDFGADTSAAALATKQARDAANAALQAQVTAKADATSAADAGGENTRLASEAAMRRLASGSMFGAGGTAAAGPPPVFTRELFGQ